MLRSWRGDYTVSRLTQQLEKEWRQLETLRRRFAVCLYQSHSLLRSLRLQSALQAALMITGPVLLSAHKSLQLISVFRPAEWQAWHPEETGTQPAAGCCTTGSRSQAPPVPLSSFEAALQGTRPSTERVKCAQARCYSIVENMCCLFGHLKSAFHKDTLFPVLSVR